MTRKKKQRDFKRRILKEYKQNIIKLASIGMHNAELQQRNGELHIKLEEYRRFVMNPIIKYWREPEAFCPDSFAIRCEMKAPDSETAWFQSRTIVPNSFDRNMLIDVLNRVGRDFAMKFFEKFSFVDRDRGINGSYYERYSRIACQTPLESLNVLHKEG